MFLLQKYLDVRVRQPDRQMACASASSGAGIGSPGSLRRSIAHVEERTSEGTVLHLRVAIDYSARDALLAAAGRVAKGIPPTPRGLRTIPL